MDKYTQYTTFDNPIPYKKLLIYPPTLREYYLFHFLSDCLLIDKNSIPDIKIITMTYLEYLFHTATVENEKPYFAMFHNLLKLVLKRDEDNFQVGKDVVYGSFDVDGRPGFAIDGEVYNSDDFDVIKEIIIEQNLLEPPDETIQKKLRDVMEEAKRYRQSLNQNKMASFEEQLICVMISTPLKLEDIYNLTIRKFAKILERVDLKLHYQIYLGASLSGMVEFKDKSFIKHWMTELKKDKFDGMLTSVETVENKINITDKK